MMRERRKSGVCWKVWTPEIPEDKGRRRERKGKPAVDRGAIPRGCENADRMEDGMEGKVCGKHLKPRMKALQEKETCQEKRSELRFSAMICKLRSLEPC